MRLWTLILLASSFAFLAVAALDEAATTRASKPSVGVIVSDCSNGTLHDGDVVVAGLITSGQFSKVDHINACFESVTSTWMKLHDVLLYYTDYDLPDPVSFGNQLADYLDGGGAVVTALFQVQTCCSGSIAGGRFASDYQVIIPTVTADTNAASTWVGDINFPQHPIMQHFTNFTTVLAAGSQFMWHMVFANNSLEPNSYILSRFQDNTYIVVVRDSVGPGKKNRVDLGFFPDDAFDYIQGVNQPGAQKIVIQSLLYAVGDPYISLSKTIATCTIPSAKTFFPNVAGVSVVSQSPSAGTVLNSVQSTTLSFTVNLPGPTTMSGNVQIFCDPNASKNAAARGAESALMSLFGF